MTIGYRRGTKGGQSAVFVAKPVPGSAANGREFAPNSRSPSRQRFAAWANQSLPLETETKLWFQSLSPERLAVLTQFVDEFCQSMGFEISWLLDEQMAENRDLEHMLTAVVKHYLEACWSIPTFRGKLCQLGDCVSFGN